MDGTSSAGQRRIPTFRCSFFRNINSESGTRSNGVQKNKWSRIESRILSGFSDYQGTKNLTGIRQISTEVAKRFKRIFFIHHPPQGNGLSANHTGDDNANDGKANENCQSDGSSVKRRPQSLSSKCNRSRP